MSEKEDKFQQQILFDEIKTTQNSSSLPNVVEQVILPSDDFTEVALDKEIEQSIKKSKKPRRLWKIAFLTFMVLMILEVIEFFTLGFANEPIIASLYGVLLVVLAFISGSYLFKELRGLRQFKQRRTLQSKVEDILLSKEKHDVDPIFNKISAQLPCDLALEKELESIQNDNQELTSAEQVRLYSRRVLSVVDEKALDKVSKFSTESVVLVALSPIAIVDMLLILWRNLKMLDEIAQLYGLKLSYWSRIKLIKQVFVNMVYAGASELIADVGTELLGADLLGKLSARIAQGLGAGMLTARLGLKTIELCRPIPFQDNKPTLKDVRKQLITQIKALTSK